MGTFETVKDFISHLNVARRLGRWYGGTFTVEGSSVQIKAYGTWNQILTVDGVRCGGNHNQSVSAWKQEIAGALTK